MYEIFLTKYFTDWYNSLTEDEQDTIQANLLVLKQYGFQLGRPKADTITDSKITHLKELRIQHAGRPYRAFFVFDPTRKAVLLCGGDKTGDKRFYDRMIPIAESVYQDYLATIELENKK